ncbi:hypothetical protein ACHAXS_008409 [Conticribra weissflogii]
MSPIIPRFFLLASVVLHPFNHLLHHVAATSNNDFFVTKEKFDSAMKAVDVMISSNRESSKRKKDRDETASNDVYGDILNDLLFSITINGTTLTHKPFPSVVSTFPSAAPTIDASKNVTSSPFIASEAPTSSPTSQVSGDGTTSPNEMPTWLPTVTQASFQSDIPTASNDTYSTDSPTVTSTTASTSVPTIATTDSITSATPTKSTNVPTSTGSLSGSSMSSTSYEPTTSTSSTSTRTGDSSYSISSPPTKNPSISQKHTYFPTSSQPNEIGDGENDPENDSISVNLPRIICDITLPSSLSESMQQKHILLLAMTNSIYDVIDKHLPMYDLIGVALAIFMSKSEIDENIRRSLTSSISASNTTRLNAEFTGTASFSIDGAPSQEELTHTLLSHFDVEAFGNRLKSPSTLRVADTMTTDPSTLELNSVYFLLDDGSVVEAGANGNSALESKLPANDGPKSFMESSRTLQVTVAFVALVAIAFILAVTMLVVHLKRVFRDEDDDNEEEVFDEREVLGRDSNSSDGNETLPNLESLQGEAGTGSPSKDCIKVDLENRRMEIHVPQTSQIRYAYDLSTIDDDDLVSVDLSEVSSLSVSPSNSTVSVKKPPNSVASELGVIHSSGLGITAPNYQYKRGLPNPYYTGKGSGFHDEEWKSSYLSDALEMP